MPTQLSGQFDLVSAIETVPLPDNTDVASFTDANNTDTSAAFTATIDWGDGTTTTGTVVGSNGSFTVQGGHTYADDNFYAPTATITRTADNSTLVLFGGVNVSDTDSLHGSGAPAITASPNQALTNVTVATFTDTNTVNTASDFVVNIDWGDGTTTSGTLTGSNGSFTVTGSHTYTSAGNFTITTFMNDDSPDAAFDSATTQANIGFGGTETFQFAQETVAVPSGTQVATFSDNSGLASTDYTASIDWGDGTTTAGSVSGSGGSFTVTSASGHTYADEGLFTETVTITRTTDNAAIAPSGTVQVFDTDDLNASGTTINGTTVLNNVTVATFTDSNTTNTAGDFVATIDWGDGTTSTGTISGSSGSFTVKGSHTYAEAGQDTVTVSIAEDPSDGQSFASATATTNVASGFGGHVILQQAAEGDAVPTGTAVATFADNAGLTSSDYTATIDWGDGTTTAGTVSGSNGFFTVASASNHTYADEASLTATVTVTRTTDNAVITPSGSVSVTENDALTASGTTISGDLALNNVTVATFSDTNTTNVAGDFTASIDWGDGTTTTGTVSGSSGSFSVNGSHTYAQNGQDTINVFVADDDPGSATAFATSTAIVGLQPGTGSNLSTAEGVAISPGTQVATFTDGDTNDTVLSFTASIDWGDGTTTAGTVVGASGSFTVVGGPHTYADEALDTVTTTVTRTSDNTQVAMSGSATVTESDILVPQGTSIGANAGVAFSGAVATFTDSYIANAAGDFTAMIDWGDGTTTSGTVSGSNGSFTVSGTHTYAAAGSFTIQVQGADDSPGTATFSTTSTAHVIAITGHMVLTSATEAVALPNSTAVATFTDSNHSDTASSFTATIDWGDGVTTNGTVVGSNGTFTVDGGHTYADEGSDTAVVTLKHTSDNTQATASGTVAVAEDDVLTGHNGGKLKAKTNQAFSGAVATFSDTDTANVAGDFTASINWGDGTTSNGTVSGGNGSFTVSGTHTYAHSGKEDLLVTLTDDSPGTASATAHAEVTVSSDPGNSENAPGHAGDLGLLSQFAAAGFGSSGGAPAVDTGTPLPPQLSDPSPLTPAGRHGPLS